MAEIQMTTDGLQQLIEAVRSGAASTAVVSATASIPKAKQPKRSFSDCTYTFRGARDHNVVEAFITAIVTYKRVEQITDDDALRGLSLLFSGFASKWWKGVKREAKTWNDALELIRSHFSPTKPPYHIYMDIAEEKQPEGTSIDKFVCQKRALLAQLPEARHDEETEIDLIYGLLDISYRKAIPRHDVKTFRDLLEKGRNIERNIKSFRSAVVDFY